MEAPPAPPIVLMVTLLGTFALLVGFMPADFFFGASQPQYAERSTPSIWFQDEIQNLTQQHFINITGSLYTEEWGVAEGFGHDMYFIANRGGGSPYFMGNYHTHPLDPFFYLWNHHYMEWKNVNGTSRGTVLRSNEIPSDATNSSAGGIQSARYRLECSHFYIISYVLWNGTLYGTDQSGLEDAWDADEVYVQMGIDSTEIGRSHVMNAWDIIAMLLFFQLPDTHVIINAIVAVPLWTMIAILSFQLLVAVVKALPFT